jgi:hypothetical protein
MAAGDAWRKRERTTVHKKTKALQSTNRKQRFCYPYWNNKCSERLAEGPCTRPNRRFCIPKPLSGEPAPVNTQKTEVFCCVRKRVVSLGFCCGGFSSTAGYVPGNEAQVRRHERHSSQRLFLSDGSCSFLSEQLGEPEG